MLLLNTPGVFSHTELLQGLRLYYLLYYLCLHWVFSHLPPSTVGQVIRLGLIVMYELK